MPTANWAGFTPFGNWDRLAHGAKHKPSPTVTLDKIVLRNSSSDSHYNWNRLDELKRKYLQLTPTVILDS